MTTLARGFEVAEDEAGITMTRRQFPWRSWALGGALAAMGVLFALDADSDGWSLLALLVGVTASAVSLPARAQDVAQRGLVKHLRRRLVITPERAGGYRNGAKPATVSVDGRERPLADLRRVAVERRVVIEMARDGSAQEVPVAGTVALVFDDEAVVVGRTGPVDGAVALAGRIAGAAKLETGWFADVVGGVTMQKGALYSGARRDALNAVGSIVTALPMEAYRGRITKRYGGHLSLLRSTAAVLVVSLVLLATIIAVVNLEEAAFARTAVGRWVCAVGALALWAVGDAAALFACAAIVRSVALTRAREVYGLP